MESNYFLCLLLLLFLTFSNALNRHPIRDEPNLYSSYNQNNFTRQLADQSINHIIFLLIILFSDFDFGHAFKTVKIHGSSAYGYYFTTLYFGTPPQKETLIVDTGSTITAVPCTGNAFFTLFFFKLDRLRK